MHVERTTATSHTTASRLALRVAVIFRHFVARVTKPVAKHRTLKSHALSMEGTVATFTHQHIALCVTTRVVVTAANVLDVVTIATNHAWACVAWHRSLNARLVVWARAEKQNR